MDSVVFLVLLLAISLPFLENLLHILLPPSVAAPPLCASSTCLWDACCKQCINVGLDTAAGLLNLDAGQEVEQGALAFARLALSSGSASWVSPGVVEVVAVLAARDFRILLAELPCSRRQESASSRVELSMSKVSFPPAVS
jgi:hypothetical protein